MAGKRTRRRFTTEFKAQTVKRLLEGGRVRSAAVGSFGSGSNRYPIMAHKGSSKTAWL